MHVVAGDAVGLGECHSAKAGWFSKLVGTGCQRLCRFLNSSSGEMWIKRAAKTEACDYDQWHFD